MCILLGIYVWTKNVEMMVVERFFFQQNLVSCIVRNSSPVTCSIVMTLNDVLDYHIEMCILSTDIVEVKAV